MNAERFRIADALLRSDQVLQQHGSSVAGPSMVLAAFAAELCLKCLFLLESGQSPPDTHDLRRLFSHLSSATQKEIEAIWDSYSAGADRVRLHEIIERETGKSVPKDLKYALRAGGDGFVALRYFHEERNSKVQFFLGDFHIMVRKVILRRKPEWARLVHTPAKPFP